VKLCPTCKLLKDEITILKGKLTRARKRLATNQEQWVETFQEIQNQKQLFMVNAGKVKHINMAHNMSGGG